jgi:hypothetical protein
LAGIAQSWNSKTDPRPRGKKNYEASGLFPTGLIV